MIIDTEENFWTYQRDKSVRRPLDQICLKTVEGIPYLRPEIQLLHKAGSSQVREKHSGSLILYFLVQDCRRFK